VTDLGDFAPRRLAIDTRYLGQNRVPHGVECLGNQRRTADATGIPGAERDRSVPPTMRKRTMGIDSASGQSRS